jgi:hypothetical protein
MPTPPSLRQSPPVPESRLPSAIRRLVRPPPLGRADALAFLRWQKKALGRTAEFWRDFGLTITESGPDRLLARGTCPAPCIAVAERGGSNRFLGAAFLMSADTDLEVYARDCGGTWLEAHRIPGGGRGIELHDPAGRSVWLVQGQQACDPLPRRPSVNDATNTPDHRPRVNTPVRTPVLPAPVVSLGHLVLQTVEFDTMARWYMRVLGLLPTDVQYLADGSPALAFLRLDRGSVPADHHTLVLVGGVEERYEHSAYEVIDLDALGQGQQVLRAQGWRHAWGIGRHLLGSQLFDYWRDPEGFEYEHYTDGDLFTADAEPCYSPLSFGSLWAWGPDAPASMKPRPTPARVLRVLRLLVARRITVQRLKLLSQALHAPARPWS